MKKLISTILCVGLLSINLAGFAAETSPVKLNIVNTPLQSVLQNKYAAYRIDFINEGVNPLRVVSTACYNRVVKPDITGDTMKLTKNDKILLMLSPLTLGITGMVYGWKTLGKTNNYSSALLEAHTLDTYINIGTAAKDIGRYEIIGSGGITQLNVLVPVNEKPQVTGNFEDIITHQYIKVENK